MVTAGFNSWRRQQFAYGTADCCQFIAHMIKSLGGPDYSDFADYDSHESAQAIIDQHGGLGGFIESVLGDPSDDLDDGDPVLCAIPKIGEVMGVKWRNGVVCLVEKGMIHLSGKYVSKGWSVCHR